MRKLFLLVLISCLLFFCSPKQQEVERYMEDGVEVIVNHLEPYKIEGEPSTLHLEEEFRIDTERDEIAELGLTDIAFYDGAHADSEGNIYLWNWESKEKIIFKFDRDGNFIKSFLRKGQGPGEVQWIECLYINNSDNIEIADPSSRKFIVLNRDGNLIKEIRLNMKYSRIASLENGKYLAQVQKQSFTNDIIRVDYLLLCNSEFEVIKELDRLNFYKTEGKIKERMTPKLFNWSVSKGNIYFGNEERGYEIRVYDLEGNLRKIIRKEAEPVEVSEEYKKSVIETIEKSIDSRPKEIRERFYFPKYLPPYRYVFSDDEGRLFVITYEKGEKTREYYCDIFNSEGIFIEKISLNNYGIDTGALVSLPAKPKNNRLYCLREKESGYKELVVYKMRWE